MSGRTIPNTLSNGFWSTGDWNLQRLVPLESTLPLAHISHVQSLLVAGPALPILAAPRNHLQNVFAHVMIKVAISNGDLKFKPVMDSDLLGIRWQNSSPVSLAWSTIPGTWELWKVLLWPGVWIWCWSLGLALGEAVSKFGQQDPGSLYWWCNQKAAQIVKLSGPACS